MKRQLVTLLLLLLGYSLNQFASQIFPPLKSKVPNITQEATSAAKLAPGESEKATVTRVIDGDTIELSDKRRVRYIGIDAPETVDPRKPVQCFGAEAKTENRMLVEGKTVILEKDISDTDYYRRELRYVYRETDEGKIFINDYLVRQGYARLDTVPPNVKYSEQFRQAEQEARDNNRGLWAGCSKK